ncbi:hypothetical protein JX265_009468 [Neoarthrinium moseri]|uniref:C2H2-type domain-containing protein n=1 Tax=Neoarthrinium moseri TaxID=1658444 RepID=A0A9P9WG08_9PEZI|nr:uncharacterized protein JN550_010700 [Neoarthrinium moseri]KAI1861501.1 hypothetical protein JX265_009468 [Neoarthrinium moseri]KAI1861760.1 hypothetical protein JN550_010700 [Neoarthrinium moseri]
MTKPSKELPLQRFLHRPKSPAIDEGTEAYDGRTTRSNTPSLTYESTQSGSPSLKEDHFLGSPHTDSCDIPDSYPARTGDFWSATEAQQGSCFANSGYRAAQETYPSDSETESDDESSGSDDWSGQEDDIEPMVLAAVGNDLKLAAYLIPIIYQEMSADASRRINRKVGHWQSMVASHGGQFPPQSDALGNGAPAQTNSGSFNQQSRGNPLKRARRSSSSDCGKDVDEEDGDGDEKEDGDGDRQGDGPPGKSAQLPRLACPFHKLNPQKYAIQHEVQESQHYKSCSGPGFKSIQRLKEHLKRKHYPVQCDRCYEIFRGSDRSVCMSLLEDHRQKATPCERGDSTLREGISDAQWAKLDGKRGNKNSQEKHRVQKWFEIWVVLFPDEERPGSPWYEGTVGQHGIKASKSPQSSDFMRLFNAILNHKVQQKDIIFPENLRERIEAVAESAFSTWLGTSYQRASTDSSSSLTRSYLYPSMVGGSSTHLSGQLGDSRYYHSQPSSHSRRSHASSGSFGYRPAPLMLNQTTSQTVAPPQFNMEWVAPMTPSSPEYVLNNIASMQGRASSFQPFGIGTRHPPEISEPMFASSGLQPWNQPQSGYTDQNAFPMPGSAFAVPVSNDPLSPTLMEESMDNLRDMNGNLSFERGM